MPHAEKIETAVKPNPKNAGMKYRICNPIICGRDTGVHVKYKPHMTTIYVSKDADKNTIIFSDILFIVFLRCVYTINQHQDRSKKTY